MSSCHARGRTPFRLGGRRDLEVSLRLSGGERYHTTLHRAVGLACLPCFWDDEGRLLAQPYAVEAHNWDEHEVHHLRGNNDCRLKALAVVTKELHVQLTAGELGLASRLARADPLPSARRSKPLTPCESVHMRRNK